MEFETLQKIIADTLNISTEKITPETRFVEDLGADSLDLFQIVLAIEETFEISMSDSQAERISTVADAVEEIKRSVNE